MKHKIAFLIATLFCAVLLLASCNEEAPSPCENGHTETVLAAVDPTCTETGLTEGKLCSVCKTVTVAQVNIPALGHEWVYGEIVIDPRPGVKTESNDVCMICDHRRVNTVYYENTQITEERWNEIFSESSFSNVIIYYVRTDTTVSSNFIRAVNGTVYYNDVMRGADEPLSIMEGALGYKNAVTLNGKFSEFEYDAAKRTYKGGYFVPGNTPVTMECEITFSDNKMMSMTLRYGEQTFQFSYSGW